MRENLGFLKTSSVVVKVAAWFFLFLGLVGGIGVLLGFVPGKTIIDGVITLVVFIFLFFFCNLIAKIADLLVRVINEIKKEEQMIQEVIK